MSAPSTSRFLHTPRSFTGMSRFLREGMVQEETRALRISVGTLSEHIEAAMRARRTDSDAQALARCIEALTRCARAHQLELLGMGSAWHALHEFGGYQRALRELRDALARWQEALLQRSPAEAERFGIFERLAWRTLGDALLVLELYEQGDVQFGDSDASRPTRSSRRRALLSRLRAWWFRVVP